MSILRNLFGKKDTNQTESEPQSEKIHIHKGNIGDMKSDLPPEAESHQSQVNKVFRHLLNNESIDFMTALNNYGVYRLSSVIHKLRNKGYQIQTDNTTKPCKYYLSPNEKNL